MDSSSSSYAGQVARGWLCGRSCSQVEEEVPERMHPKSLRGPPGTVDRDLIPPRNHVTCMGEFLGCVDLARCHPSLEPFLVVPVAALGPPPLLSRMDQDGLAPPKGALRRRMIACPRVQGFSLWELRESCAQETSRVVVVLTDVLCQMLEVVFPALLRARVNHWDLSPRNVLVQPPLGEWGDEPAQGEVHGTAHRVRIVDVEFATYHAHGLFSLPRVCCLSCSDPSYGTSLEFDPDADWLFFFLCLAGIFERDRFPACFFALDCAFQSLCGVPLAWFLERRSAFCPWAADTSGGCNGPEWNMYFRLSGKLGRRLRADREAYLRTRGKGPFPPILPLPKAFCP